MDKISKRVLKKVFTQLQSRLPYENQATSYLSILDYYYIVKYINIPKADVSTGADKCISEI